ncbi:heavy metal-associated isoprenylated plant protein 28 [Phragmites australis]|uniref:heavy metal-associated isoprenylated plant protein 28 n=1 Tax=Phragmites australis TaxID=29695 RepID=UPI002D792D47|nr:heavy metal-associated isoprenylated plant protein 28 [Phragmites australis]
MGDMQIVLAGRKIEAQYVEMKVPLYSYGCEKKIKKALSHLKGIHSVQVDYHQQKVTVWGICNRDDVLAAVRKKRRAARFWGADEPGPGEDLWTTGDAPKHYLAAFTAYRCRKAWKKLFPLIRP